MLSRGEWERQWYPLLLGLNQLCMGYTPDGVTCGDAWCHCWYGSWRGACIPSPLAVAGHLRFSGELSAIGTFGR